MKRRNRGIKAIIFAGARDPLRERLHLVISMHLAMYKIEVCQTVASLSQRLHGPLPNPLIILLLISNREELCDILALCDLLNDRRIILILPDDNPDNLAMAHTLRPRFITYRDRDFLDVSAVLGRMIARQGSDKTVVAAEKTDRGISEPDDGLR